MPPPLRQVGLRLSPEMLSKLDAWIARQRRPLTRGQAIRILLADRLQMEADADPPGR